MLTLLFLGRLEDVAGEESVALDMAAPATLAEIAERLKPELAVAICAPEVRVALNGELVEQAALRAANGNELAFLPPVSGG
ncbi:MoaD/ThiS family protein [Croceicoccus naphthovorans]|uniref:Uncharacterized protein n=1 Tax=Croceicoccus naphthovorans TaxID=1348774 RepID=A0A0G3XIW4_9SPHN|nr:MoaD/ThiS family protein [Croceicoccus naphthovorans]AKM10546.1 hypothetical protein AB433_12160 [Croceicoccus naphthovorans]MBB3988745.1 molybdopterin converting factor small subunit [Croceicoccus naphthovorans]